MNSNQEVVGELVVSGGNAAEVLEPTKAALDDVSAFVGASVEVMDGDAAGFVGDDGLGAATRDFAAKLVAVISSGSLRAELENARSGDVFENDASCQRGLRWLQPMKLAYLGEGSVLRAKPACQPRCFEAPGASESLSMEGFAILS